MGSPTPTSGCCSGRECRQLATIVLSLLVVPVLAIYTVVVAVVLDMDRAYAQYALIIPVAYVLGSIPWGYLITLAVKGEDIRHYGSGKTGMTNVLRTVGGRFAVLALVLDVSKGVLAVFLARAVADTATVEVVAGLAALLGHNWSVFLGFAGGRGIATGLGGLLVIEPIAAGIALASFAPTTLISRYVSLGCLTALAVAFLAALVIVLLGYSSETYLLYPGIGGALIVWQHKENVRRLLRGTERRLGQSAEKFGEAASPGVGRG